MSTDQGISSSNNNNGNLNSANNNSGFQAGRPQPDHLGHTLENQMAMLQLKQQPMASSFTRTVYTGPPAKYLNNTANNFLRPMMTTPKYMSYNSPAPVHQRRQNNAPVENATNDLVNKRKVFVGGLTPDTKMEHLRDYFSKFGNIENATVKYDKSGRSKGFGFVLFEDPSTPEQVYAQEVHIIQGKRVDTKSAHRRDQALARKVFVGGLDPDVTDNELKEYFSQFGKITQIEAPVDKSKQKRRPFCFILFESEQSAEEVLKQMRHTLAGKTIDCKRANPKTMDNNQANNPMIPQNLPHFPMTGINQNPYQYAQSRSQQQLPYPQVALAAQPQQHYSFYNASSLGQQTNQQGQNQSQLNRQQMTNNNQAWSPISPAQWQNTNYVDPRSFGSFGTGPTTNTNANWQVQGQSQGNNYGQARNQSANSSNNPGTNSTSGHYSYQNWPYNQSQGPLPNQYNFAADSANGPGNTFAYPTATAYDQF